MFKSRVVVVNCALFCVFLIFLDIYFPVGSLLGCFRELMFFVVFRLVFRSIFLWVLLAFIFFRCVQTVHSELMQNYV